MTIPLRVKSNKRGRYTDGDETERRRARDVDALNKAYRAGGAQSDFPTKFDAAADHKMLSRIRQKPLGPAAMKQVIQGYSESIRKRR